MCDCDKWWGIILGLVIVVFTLWTPAVWVKWLVVVAGIIIILHAFGCCKCNCETNELKVKRKKK